MKSSDRRRLSPITAPNWAAPSSNEARLRDLLAKQAKLNACLDLDKHEAQIDDESRENEELGSAEVQAERILPAPTQTRAFGPSAAPS
jgi:hypothetical protein